MRQPLQVADKYQVSCGFAKTAQEVHSLVLVEVVQEEGAEGGVAALGQWARQSIGSEKANVGPNLRSTKLGVGHGRRVAVAAFDLERHATAASALGQPNGNVAPARGDIEDAHRPAEFSGQRRQRRPEGAGGVADEVDPLQPAEGLVVLPDAEAGWS
jgi:hypothetical protein